MKFVYFLVFLIFLGCETKSENSNQLALLTLTYPVITSVEPRAVNSSFSLKEVNYPASTAKILGRNFSTNLSENVVAFNGISASVTASTSTELTVTVPSGVYSGIVTVSKSGGVCDSLDKKSGINCGGADIFVSCYGAFKEEYGVQVLIETNKSNKVTFSKSPLDTKAFRVELPSGLRTFTLTCPTQMDITTFSKICAPKFSSGVQPSSSPQITLEGGYTAEFLVTTQPGECTFTIY